MGLMENSKKILTLKEVVDTQHAEKHFYIILKEQQKILKKYAKGIED